MLRFLPATLSLDQLLPPLGGALLGIIVLTAVAMVLCVVLGLLARTVHRDPLPEPESNPAPASGDPITVSRDYRASSKYDYYPETGEIRRRTGYRKHVNESGTTKEPIYEREPAVWAESVQRVGGTVAGTRDSPNNFCARR